MGPSYLLIDLETQEVTCIPCWVCTFIALDEGHQSPQLTSRCRGWGGDANIKGCTWGYLGGTSSFRIRAELCLPYYLPLSLSPTKSEWRIISLNIPERFCAQPCSDDSPATQMTSSSWSIKMMHSRPWSYATQFLKMSFIACV